jgi:hypothetical protein
MMEWSLPSGPSKRALTYLQAFADREECSVPTSQRGRCAEMYVEPKCVEFVCDELAEYGFKYSVTDCGKARLSVTFW